MPHNSLPCYIVALIEPKGQQMNSYAERLTAMMMRDERWKEMNVVSIDRRGMERAVAIFNSSIACNLRRNYYYYVFGWPLASFELHRR